MTKEKYYAAYSTLSTLSSYDLGEIVAAASTISERFSGDFCAATMSPDDEKLLLRRFDAWCQTIAAGNIERFREILAWNGYDITKVRQLLGHVRLREHTPLPTWTTTLQEVLLLIQEIPCAHSTVDKTSWSFLTTDTSYPFEELLAPFVVVAQRRYETLESSAYHILSTEAQRTLQRHLLQVLTSLAMNTLHTAFQHHAQDQPSLQEQEKQADDTVASYHQFIMWMYQGGFCTFLRSYSSLARILATTTDLWVEAHVEFLQRLQSDWAEIQHVFGAGSVPEQVIAIEPALSDPHNGRRCVMALTLSSGKKLVYKPRSIGIEVSYYQLLDWCNQQGTKPPLKSLATIERNNYGWIEFVTYEPCRDQQELQRYYHRAGMLLCLVYLLGGVDCFYEQIIAHGEHPILIDPGMLLHAYPCPDHQDDPLHKQCSDWEQHHYSVLRSGLVTSWQMNASPPPQHTIRPYRDISGLDLLNANNHSDTANTQPSMLKYGMVRLRECFNMPQSHISQLSSKESCDAICAGFTDMYQLLRNNHAPLLADHGPLQVFRQQAVRFIYRPEWEYLALSAELVTPRYMRDGVERNIAMEGLWIKHIPVEYKVWREGNSTAWRQVCLAEQQALLQGDIPFFTMRTDRDVLLTGQEEIAACLHEPGFDLLLKRLQQLSDTDKSVQLGLIRKALYRGQANTVVLNDADTVGKAPSTDALRAQALTLAETITRQAIYLDHDAVTWIQPRFLMRSYRHQLQTVRYSVFNGSAGIALFLAAAARVSGDTTFHALARAAVQPLCRALHAHGEDLAREMGIGGAVGLGSVVYALTRISQFLDAPELLHAASQAAQLISMERITTDKTLDIIAGSAGAITGLLALYAATHEQSALDRALACSHHLLQVRIMSKAGCLAWPTLGQLPTTGFSHGTAGIAYALLRVYAVTGETSLLQAASEGLIYENHAFMSQRGNWAEFLTDKDPQYTSTWCHGAPGIGLARIGGLPMLDTAHIRQDIEAAIQTTQQVGTAGYDHLCCGISGRAEILFTAGQKLRRPELMDLAKRNMWSILSRAEQRGTFLIDPSLPKWVPIIDLFRGSAGIGYTLLRMADPDRVPSMLLWE